MIKKLGFSIALLLFIAACTTKTIFNTTNVNNRYTIDLPEYFQPCSDLHKDASLQYQNTDIDIYAMVIEEKKVTMENYDLDYDLDLYFKNIASQPFIENIKNGKVSPPGRQEIAGNNSLISEITGNVDGIDVYYRMAIIESPYSFYQVLLWTRADKKEKYLNDIIHTIESFKELAHSEDELPQPKINTDSVQIKLAY
ncbi:MAG: hypothetical protein JNL69_07545 [Bacteroidia bacterium]|nr:hypothetical protein [Bacteroidia bacterium]